MESQPSILGTVCQLSYTNAALFEELAALEDGRNHLDRRFESDLSALNKTISELSPVIDVLLLEKPPPLKPTFGDSLLALRSGKWQLPTLSTVQTAVSNISKVESNIQASQKEASAKKIDTADLASKAAGHIDRCSSVHTQVSDAQTQTRALLDTTERHIVRAQQQIEENLKLSADMASEATSRDEQAEGNNLLFWTTFWIPVVNIITIPIALTMEKEHRHQAAACRDMVTKLNAEVKEKSAEKLELETTSSQLNGALSDLKVAGAEAQQTAKQASNLQDQAKALTDQYGLITTRVRDVLRGLGHVRHDVSAELWDETRFTALLALRGMLTTLKERGMLSPKSLLVAGIAENVHVPVVQGPGLLDDL